jgi:hypothetical protein
LIALYSIVTPFTSILMSLVCGILGPSNTVSPCSSSSVNTNTYWLLRMCAFVLLSELSSVPRFRRGTLQISYLWDFIYIQNGLLSPDYKVVLRILLKCIWGASDRLCKDDRSHTVSHFCDFVRSNAVAKPMARQKQSTPGSPTPIQILNSPQQIETNFMCRHQWRNI